MIIREYMLELVTECGSAEVDGHRSLLTDTTLAYLHSGHCLQEIPLGDLCESTVYLGDLVCDQHGQILVLVWKPFSNKVFQAEVNKDLATLILIRAHLWAKKRMLQAA